MTGLTTIDLPPAFYDDHVARDLPGGTEVHRTNRWVRVELTPAELAEVRSDAHHYATEPDYRADYPGLVASARATVRIIDAATTPTPSKEHPMTEPTTPAEAVALACPHCGSTDHVALLYVVPSSGACYPSLNRDGTMFANYDGTTEYDHENQSYYGIECRNDGCGWAEHPDDLPDDQAAAQAALLDLLARTVEPVAS